MIQTFPATETQPNQAENDGPLPTAYCPLLTAYCPLPTAHCSLPTAHCPLRTPWELFDEADANQALKMAGEAVTLAQTIIHEITSQINKEREDSPD